MARTMKAARMHHVGEPMIIEDLPIPEVRPTDVLVKVKACNIVPNLGNVLANWTEWFPHLPLPRLPAIFGLDASGTIEEVGSQVHAWQPGDRVYVNPARYCGGCRACRSGNTTACPYYTFNGYFGFSQLSQKMFDDYPYAGLGEYMTAPQYSLVKLPDNLGFEAASRFGYIGTGYRALRRANVGPGTTVLINGISGTLGLGCLVFALGLGTRKILGTGRNLDLLKRVKALAPDRIEVHQLGDVTTDTWAREVTGGVGVDVVIDALGPGAPQKTMLEALAALRRGGVQVNIGAVAGDVPVDLHYLMDNDIQLTGSAWFTSGQGQEMADLVETGAVDMSVFEHRRYALSDINTALAGIENRDGGFSNFVICP